MRSSSTKMRFAMIATCLSTSACAHSGAPSGPLVLPLHYTAYVDSAFTADQQQDIVSAIDAWQAAAPGLAIDVQIGSCRHIDTSFCYTAGSVAQERSALTTDGIDANSYEAVGQTAPDGTITFFPPAWENGQTTWATLHETGHALGLIHTGEGTLMSPWFGQASQSITDEDLTQFWALRPAR